MKICRTCHREFKPSSRHNDCPSCRRQFSKVPCPKCDGLMNKESTLCMECTPPTRLLGDLHPRWKGGYLMPSGYKRVRTPLGHPRLKTTSDPYILEHILIMENHLGRYLKLGETIHHKNGVKGDNRIENLELWVSNHPSGSRVSDLVDYAHKILNEYGRCPAYY